MLFNSYIFVFLFLPIVVIGYFTLNHFKKFQIANIFLILMSLWFYGYFNPKYLLVICGSITLNYLTSRIILKKEICRNFRKFVLVIGIILNLLCIFVFKYYDFFIENINNVFSTSFNLLNVALPLGISFITFQQISYLVDSYRGETADYGFGEYALFVCFFPQLIAGPIVLHKEIIPQFRNTAKRKWNSQNFSKGMYIFSIGLFKKVLLADTFGKLVAIGYGTVDTLTSMEALIVSLSYTFQLYFDFSGYCDMALGIGSMLNIDITQNFNSPYKATSIVDFWSRWHMSLTRFLREYVYFPLGGSKKGTLRTYLNIMIVFLLSGIWHGANWTFIIWGICHGIANCLNRIAKKSWEKLNTVYQWFLTFSFVNIMWIVFRANSVQEAIAFIKRLFSMNGLTIRKEFFTCFNLPEFRFLEQNISLLGSVTDRIIGFNMWLFIAVAFFVVLNMKNSKEIDFKPTVSRSVVTILFIIWSVMSLSGISTFLYFDF